ALFFCFLSVPVPPYPYPLSLHDALPISDPLTFVLDYLGPKGFWTFRSSVMEKGFRMALLMLGAMGMWKLIQSEKRHVGVMLASRSEEHTSELQSRRDLVCRLLLEKKKYT